MVFKAQELELLILERIDTLYKGSVISHYLSYISIETKASILEITLKKLADNTKNVIDDPYFNKIDSWNGGALNTTISGAGSLVSVGIKNGEKIVIGLNLVMLGDTIDVRCFFLLIILLEIGLNLECLL